MHCHLHLFLAGQQPLLYAVLSRTFWLICFCCSEQRCHIRAVQPLPALSLHHHLPTPASGCTTTCSDSGATPAAARAATDNGDNTTAAAQAATDNGDNATAAAAAAAQAANDNGGNATTAASNPCWPVMRQSCGGSIGGSDGKGPLPQHWQD